MGAPFREIDIADFGSAHARRSSGLRVDRDQGHAGAHDRNIAPHKEVQAVDHGYRDGSGRRAPAKRRANEVRAILVVVLALLMINLQPGGHAFSANASIVAGIDATIISTDCHGGNPSAGMPAASHCLVHAGCAVFVDVMASDGPIFCTADWPAFNADADIGPGPRPDPKPPKYSA
jgi:hypothetical protein